MDKENMQENLEKENKINKKKTKKQYILIKNTDKEDLLKIKESFLDPNKYLISQNKIIIGNSNFPTMKRAQSALKLKSNSLSNSLNMSPINNKIDKKKNLQRFSYINNYRKKNMKIKSKSFTLNAENNAKNAKSKIIRNINGINNYQTKAKKSYVHTYLNNLENTNELKQRGIHYKIKSLGDVLNMYEKYKNLENKGKNSIEIGNKSIPNEIIEEVGKNLSGQEKILNYQKKLKNKSDLFSKLLSKKLKRKENDLLYNKLEEYRIKRQLIDIMESSKTCREKFGDNYWVADLRRPKHHSDIRYVYSNTNKDLPPDRIIDYADKDMEYISDPNYIVNYSELYKNLNIFKKTHKFKFPNFEKINKMGIIEGKNLLNQEMINIGLKENEKINNNSFLRYKLYNDPKELVTKNVNNLICKESYDIKYRIQRNRSYTNNEENKNQNIINNNNNLNNKNTYRRTLYRSKSQIGELKVKNTNKKKFSYLNEALNMIKKENKQKNSSIKIISRK